MLRLAPLAVAFTLGVTIGPPPQPPDDAGLGTAAVAVGDRLLLGAPRDGAAAGIVFVVDASAGPGFGQLVQTLVKPGTPTAGDAFGAALAATPIRIAVGAPGDDAAAVDAGAVYVFGDAGQSVRVLPPAAAGGERFGAALAAFGDDLLVGAPGTQRSGVDGAGRAYLVSATTGQLRVTFEAPDVPAPDDRFGATIVAAGTNVLVGAPGAGRAYLFDAAGTPLFTLVPELPAPDDGFGAALAGGDTTVAVGAPGGAQGAGTVSVFDATGGSLVRTIDDPSLQPGDRFGSALGFVDAGLLAGAPGTGDQQPGAGAVHLVDPMTGTLLDTLEPPFPPPGDGFGASVVPVGPQVLVGSALDPAGGGGGAFYLLSGASVEAVFRRGAKNPAFGGALAVAGDDFLVGAPGGGTVSRVDGTTGQVVATVAGPDAADVRFGFAVAAVGAPLGDVVAGAPLGGEPPGAAVGVADVLAGDALRQTLADPRPLDGDQFGWSLATVGGDVVVGAPLAGEHDTGVAYRFDGATGARRATYRKPTPGAGDFFGAAIAADAGDVLVGAPFDGSGAEHAGAAYLFQGDTAALERVLHAPSPAPGELFGAAVAFAGPRIAVAAPLAGGGGVVHLFDRASGALVATLAAPAPHPNDQFGHALAALGDDLLVGAPLADGASPDAGAVHLFDGATGVLLQTFTDPAQARFDHFGFALAAGPAGVLIAAPGASRLYLFRPGAPADVAPPVCGNGVVDPGEACDDGNAVDTDDCRNDCSGPFCCTLAPGAAASCDDGDPCTDDVLDPVTGCQNAPSGRCCAGDRDCGAGTCRVCLGCFLHPWDCCSGGSACLPREPECRGETCAAAAHCECEGGLACPGETVGALAGRLFTSACDELRLDASGADARARRRSLRRARQLVRQARRATHALVKRRAVSRACGRSLLARVGAVGRAIPTGRKLRRCVASTGPQR